MLPLTYESGVKQKRSMGWRPLSPQEKCAEQGLQDGNRGISKDFERSEFFSLQISSQHSTKATKVR